MTICHSKDTTQEVKTSLLQLLKENQNRLKGDNGVIEHNIKMRCQPNCFSSLDEPKVDERIYKVKTMNVDWEGESSCMHVFIDNSDIVKLEEAKNNMKCQRIMFSTASHEFRTPLNAIINSFTFIDDTF